MSDERTRRVVVTATVVLSIAAGWAEISAGQLAAELELQAAEIAAGYGHAVTVTADIELGEPRDAA